MIGVTPPWANFLAGASDKIVTPARTSYGAPKPMQNANPIPSQQGPRIGAQRPTSEGYRMPRSNVYRDRDAAIRGQEGALQTPQQWNQLESQQPYL